MVPLPRNFMFISAWTKSGADGLTVSSISGTVVPLTVDRHLACKSFQVCDKQLEEADK